jgi:Flp pilus assembly protein TadD
MSLLNQVLQDLDERAPVTQPRSPHLTVAPAATLGAEELDDRRPNWIRLGAGAGIVSAFVAAVLLFHNVDEADVESVQPQLSVTVSAVPELVLDAVTEELDPAGVESGASDGASVRTVDSAPLVQVQSTVSPAVNTAVPSTPAVASVTVASVSKPVTSAAKPAPAADADASGVADSPTELSYLRLRNTELPVAGESQQAISGQDSLALEGNQSVKTAKSPAPTAIERARQAIEQGELSSAESILQKRLQQAPADQYARELLVGLMLRGGRNDAAMRQIDRGLKLHRGHVKFNLIKARLLAQRGEAEAATRILESMRSANVGRTERLQMLGALYQQLARFEKAVDSYRSLLNLDAAAGASWVGLAISLDGLGDPTALQAYDRALELGGLPAAAESYARQRLSQLGARVD